MSSEEGKKTSSINQESHSSLCFREFYVSWSTSGLSVSQGGFPQLVHWPLFKQKQIMEKRLKEKNERWSTVVCFIRNMRIEIGVSNGRDGSSFEKTTATREFGREKK